MSTDFDAPTSDDPFQTRIDALLSSALEDQAREQKMLVETVKGARASIVRTEEELSELRRILQDRDRSVLDLLEARLSGIGSQETIEQVDGRLAELLSRSSTEQAVAPINASLTALTQRLSSLESEVSRTDPHDALRELRSGLESRIEGSLHPVRASVEELARVVGELEAPIRDVIEGPMSSLRESVESVRQGAVADVGAMLARLEAVEARVAERL
ncbi:MAG TPA: hypothetical protein VI541_04090, partial [Actinomycetota bacterium]|nr:hypothetical protein [Actinomycetota bacterium]